MVDSVVVTSSGMSAPACSRLARLGALETVEEAETVETTVQMVQEAEIVCGIDAEAGLCDLCERGGVGQSEYGERTATEN